MSRIFDTICNVVALVFIVALSPLFMLVALAMWVLGPAESKYRNP